MKNSGTKNQIIVHVNEGSDGTLEWVKASGIDYTFSSENIGICKAVNQAYLLAKHDYIVFMNDDMYCLPRWDIELMNEINRLSTDCFMLSATMIEPVATGNKCVVIGRYGRNEADFQEQKLLEEYPSLQRADWAGSTWPPSVVHRKWWEQVKGYSEEFSPGMSSDDDFARKMWEAGCRMFKGVGTSMVYHFISKSTGRVIKNDGRQQFLTKWGIKQSMFHKYYTHRGEPFSGELKDPRSNPFFALRKMMLNIFHV